MKPARRDFLCRSFALDAFGDPHLEGGPHTFNIGVLLPPRGSSCPLRLPKSLIPAQNQQLRRVRGSWARQTVSPSIPAFWNLGVGAQSPVRVSRDSDPAAPNPFRDSWGLSALCSFCGAVMGRGDRQVLTWHCPLPRAPARSAACAPALSAPYWAPPRGSCSQEVLPPELWCVGFALGPHGILWWCPSPVTRIRAGPPVTFEQPKDVGKSQDYVGTAASNGRTCSWNRPR